MVAMWFVDDLSNAGAKPSGLNPMPISYQNQVGCSMSAQPHSTAAMGV
jgi:hypothetical protein